MCAVRCGGRAALVFRVSPRATSRNRHAGAARDVRCNRLHAPSSMRFENRPLSGSTPLAIARARREAAPAASRRQERCSSHGLRGQRRGDYFQKARCHDLIAVTSAPLRGHVATPDNRGWSLYGAPWLQPVATRGKSLTRRNGENKRKPLPCIASTCLRSSMVSRASAVGCHRLREVPSLQRRGSMVIRVGWLFLVVAVRAWALVAAAAGACLADHARILSL